MAEVEAAKPSGARLFKFMHNCNQKPNNPITVNMNTTKAIQTHYKGYYFRSRLEARWAVFFEHLGIEYQYEPEGFEKEMYYDDDSKILRYLPDFYLPKLNTWVEVKGLMTDKEAQKLGDFLDWDCPLPYFKDGNQKCFSLYNQTNKAKFIILGEIPNPTGIVFHKIITHEKGLHIKFFTFTGDGMLRFITDNEADWILLFTNEDLSTDFIEGFGANSNNFKTEPVIVDSKLHYPKVKSAYLAARKARFEHGE